MRRTIRALDWALSAVAVATLIFSCFDFYRFRSNVFGTKGFSAWHDVAGGGFLGWFGVVLPVLGSLVLAVSLVEPQLNLPMEARLIALYCWLLGLLCELLAIVLHPKFYSISYSDGTHNKLGHGYTFWVILVLTLIGSVVALLSAQQAGTRLPAPLKNLPKLTK